MNSSVSQKMEEEIITLIKQGAAGVGILVVGWRQKK
jgi:hypothetical protein